MTTKTSPYIYPFTPFKYLDVTEQNTAMVDGDRLDIAALSAMAEPIAPALSLPPAETLAQRILALFTTPDILFGEASFVTSRSDEWLSRISYLIEQERPIEFTILGFPFKMPVPLKTNRKTADFGELVSLKRLNEIGRAVAQAYEPGARVHVFTEGPFHVLNGIERSWADGYFASLQAMIEQFGIDSNLVLHDLNRVADDTPEFRQVWNSATEDIRARRDAADPATLDAIKDALPVRFHNIYNPGASIDDLRRAYLNDGTREELRAAITARAEEGVLGYRAFLEARDRISLLDKYAPDAIGMTVSPRPGRLGVRPLPEPADKLPYHGVPVLSHDRNTLRIDYLWDLQHGGGTYRKVSLVGDTDPAPFVYIEE
ncbi:L-tyrosine/L-tryptophan isonitrile synthase family protein [Sinorhizobium medicae]|uniref:Pyoverdine/dityrosine biosynthesis protein n=1 Tax=Sinorhizobium medicae TaxID=110321 RepID=A0A508X7S9_9HYPH|nr:L-tyrosine/L-tryptophan isonitrile synthase family protein [Sinorhizobium medicae]VTZ65823.1 Pyoverdine/dityrosine biosynthesis protein [Sinorhizobium medicae]